MTMSPHHTFSRASPAPLGRKEPKFSQCFVCCCNLPDPLPPSPPHFPPASALACTFCLAKVKTEPINIQAVLSTKLIGSALKSATFQIKWRSITKARNPCWWRSLSFEKSRDKFRSVGWIPHKYQRAFANFQFLFRAKRSPPLRFSLCFRFWGWGGRQQWCGTLWTSWPALRLQKRKLQAAQSRSRWRPGQGWRANQEENWTLRIVSDDWSWIEGIQPIQFLFPIHQMLPRTCRNSPFCRLQNSLNLNIWRKSCLQKTNQVSQTNNQKY